MVVVRARYPTFLVLDALDECPNYFGLPTPREAVLDLLVDLVCLQLPNLHICVTSRPEFDIRSALQPLAFRSISLHNESGQKYDMVNYVCSVVWSDRNTRKWRDEDKELVVTELAERADGM
jgi:hypothetical protein